MLPRSLGLCGVCDQHQIHFGLSTLNNTNNTSCAWHAISR